MAFGWNGCLKGRVKYLTSYVIHVMPWVSCMGQVCKTLSGARGQVGERKKVISLAEVKAAAAPLNPGFGLV